LLIQQVNPRELTRPTLVEMTWDFVTDSPAPNPFHVCRHHLQIWDSTSEEIAYAIHVAGTSATSHCQVKDEAHLMLVPTTSNM
jgi:hypothetical protein